MRLLAAAALGLLAAACHGKKCPDPIAIPAELGIVDDDADWLCGSDRPERPRNLPDHGLVAAGVEGCLVDEVTPRDGNDVYLSPDGDDGNAGTTPEAPLATLAVALCRAAPGQTFHLAPGTYRDAGVVVGLLGTATSDEVVIRGEGSDPGDVVLDGDHWRSFALGFTESHHVRVENLTVQHYTDAGLYTLLGSGVTLRSIVSRSNGRCSAEPQSEGEGFGIELVGTLDVLVEDSTFEDNGPLVEPLTCGEVLGTGIDTFEATGVVRRNTIRHNRGGAMLVEDGGPMEVSDNVADHNFFLAVDNYWDAALWVDGSVDVTVRDNTFTDNWGGVGVMVTDEEGTFPTTSKDTTITGNTISGHLAGVLVWGYGTCPPPDAAIPDYDLLETANDLSGNSYGGEDTPVVCDPEFLGGDRP